MCGATGLLKYATLTLVHQPYDDECLRFWHERHKERAPKGKACECDGKLLACGCPWGDEKPAPPAPPAAPGEPAAAPAPEAPPAPSPAAPGAPAAPAPPTTLPSGVLPSVDAPDTADLEAELKAAIQAWLRRKTKK